MSKIDKVTVLAFEKKLVPSDGYLYGGVWGDKENFRPLKLIEKSVRGTISNRLKSAIRKDPAKLNNEVEKANLQKIDSCSLGVEQDTLKLKFTLKVLGGVQKPSACNNLEFLQSYAQAVKEYSEKSGFRELGKRYALNIASARYLWRNRVGAEKIQVHVKELNGDSNSSWLFNGLNYNLRDMEKTDENINSLGDKIAAVLSSNDKFLVLEIICYAKIGTAQDVYPSEELVLDKGKGNKSKILYSVDYIAAMHSQKLGNALRTIDTWYPGFSDSKYSVGPIAIEPYGAVTTLGKAFRTPKDKKDFYSYFDSWARAGQLDNIEDEHFVMGVLVRGGVFGESDK